MAGTPGSLVQEWEQAHDAIRHQAATAARTVRKAVGERPLFGVPLSPEEKAKRLLPMWYMLGLAAPEVSRPYWEAIARQGRTQLPEEMQADWRSALRFDRELRRLWEKYPHYAFDFAPPELVAIYQTLRHAGLHLGPGALKTAREVVHA